jgi:hypothetical protein
VSTPAAGTHCWPERQSWHRRAAARIHGPPLSLSSLSPSGSSPPTSSILLFPWPSISAFSLPIRGKAMKQSLIGGEAEHWGSGAATSELDSGCSGARKDNDLLLRVARR